MSDFGAGYVAGKSSSSGGIAVGIALLAAVVAAMAAVIALSCAVLFPAATAVVVVAVAIMAWFFSAAAALVWHDPSPFYLFGQHWLYVNWVAVGFATLGGLAVARLVGTAIEDGLARHALYELGRHCWRVSSAAALVAVGLVVTRQQTGMTEAGLWLLPLLTGAAMHFVFRSAIPSQLRDWIDT